MNTNWENHQNEGIKIIIDAKMYEPEKDNRLLIPFIGKYRKKGLLNKGGEVVLPAKYDSILDDCYYPDDIIRVGTLFPFGYSRPKGEVASYVKYKYNVVNVNGEFLLDQGYDDIFSSTDKCYLTVKDSVKRFAVFDIKGREIIPFGKYHWMEPFDKGLARVIDNDKWGIINTNGDEVVPLIYDKIWSWYNKKFDTIILIKDGIQYEASFDNPSVVTPLGHCLESHPPILGNFE